MGYTLGRRSLPTTLALGFALAIAAAAPAAAETVEVRMLNFDVDDPTRVMIFDPSIVRIAPGDTVRWVAVDAFHNTTAVPGMIPEGATPWASPLSEDFEVTFTVEGTYGYFCEPHQVLGMVGLILVGDPTGNLDAVKAVQHMPPVQPFFDALLAEVQ